MASLSTNRLCPPICARTHKSLFDGSLQGIERTDKPAFGFQGHPEASPGPHDVAPLFDHFIELMDASIGNQPLDKGAS
jgi:carbamoyl-phosphate synthase small subunit